MPYTHADRANVLTEALPYIQRYNGKTIVIKCDSSVMNDKALKDAVVSDLVLLHLVGVRVVVVHGGKTEIDAMLTSMGKTPVYQNGVRVTTPEVMDIVQQVLCGKVNKDLVSTISRTGNLCVGLCGIDGALFQAKQLDPELGLVGKLTKVDPVLVQDALDAGYIPVIASVAQGTDQDTLYNVSADTAASKLAVALGAERLLLLTNQRGILAKPGEESSLIPELQLSQVPALVKDGVISGDMIARVDCCVEAARSGVKSSTVLDGTIPHAILLELLSDAGVGTMLKN
ncbi:MAG: acetylglutamate kinase [Oscillospiraceae bacterium]|jgi:acetylglutamate kinase|nr:acetylglutamate kinase [Oscillospiraceae bacterium]